MGLDIYFHKVSKVKVKGEPFTKSVEECSEILSKRSKKFVKRFANSVCKEMAKLYGVDRDAYVAYYKHLFNKRIKYWTKYEWEYNRFLDKIEPIEEVKKWFNNFVETYYRESDAYFRKVNFLYKYFENKLEDECCFVTKSELEDVIDKCNKILSTRSERERLELAKTELPTRSGFFFGSTDYDKWYFEDLKDVRRQFKKLLKSFNEDTDIIYVDMSW